MKYSFISGWKVRLSCLLFAGSGLTVGSAAEPNQSFDVAAERARREEIRRANRAEDQERLKRSGAPYLLSHVEARIPPKTNKGPLPEVEVVIRVDERGIVRGVFFPNPNDPIIEEAVIKAVWQWRYSPRKVDGVPTRFETTVLVPVKRQKKDQASKKLPQADERE